MWSFRLQTSVIGTNSIWFSRYYRISLLYKMSHQNKRSGIFKWRVMVFLLIKIWLPIGMVHQDNVKILWYEWRRKGKKSYHVNVSSQKISKHFESLFFRTLPLEFLTSNKLILKKKLSSKQASNYRFAEMASVWVALVWHFAICLFEGPLKKGWIQIKVQHFLTFVHCLPTYCVCFKICVFFHWDNLGKNYFLTYLSQDFLIYLTFTSLP